MKFTILDGIRGMAAVFVMIRHLEDQFDGVSLYHSFLAVDIFFILSGFVLSEAYGNRLIRHQLSIIDLVKLRLIRFYPMLIFATACSVTLLIIRYSYGHGVDTAELFTGTLSALTTVLFLPYPTVPYDPGSFLFPLNPVYWTLFFELYINIFLAFAILWIRRSVIIFLVLLSAIAITTFAYKDGSIDNGFYWSAGSIALGGSRAFFGIFFGFYLNKFFNKNLKSISIPMSTLGPLILTMCLLAMPDIGRFNALFQTLTIFFLFPITILWAATAAVGKMTSRIMLILGAVSYPVYVIHIPLGQFLKLPAIDAIKDSIPLFSILLIVSTIVICYILESKFERPLRSKLKKLFDSKERFKLG